MPVVRAILVFVEVLTSLLLIGVVLLQKSKDEGLGLSFGSGMGESLFGSRAGNVLTKITITLGVIFLVNTVLLSMVAGHRPSESLVEGLPDAPMQTAPAGPAVPAVPEAAPAAPGL